MLPALRYIRAIGAEDSASPRKFLEAATNPEDSMLFYTGMSRDYNFGIINLRYAESIHSQPKVRDGYLSIMYSLQLILIDSVT